MKYFYFLICLIHSFYSFSQHNFDADSNAIEYKIIDSLQTIISRETELTKEGAVITIGKISSTIRTLDYGMQDFLINETHERNDTSPSPC